MLQLGSSMRKSYSSVTLFFSCTFSPLRSHPIFTSRPSSLPQPTSNAWNMWALQPGLLLRNSRMRSVIMRAVRRDLSCLRRSMMRQICSQKEELLSEGATKRANSSLFIFSLATVSVSSSMKCRKAKQKAQTAMHSSTAIRIYQFRNRYITSSTARTNFPPSCARSNSYSNVQALRRNSVGRNSSGLKKKFNRPVSSLGEVTASPMSSSSSSRCSLPFRLRARVQSSSCWPTRRATRSTTCLTRQLLQTSRRRQSSSWTLLKKTSMVMTFDCGRGDVQAWLTHPIFAFTHAMRAFRFAPSCISCSAGMAASICCILMVLISQNYRFWLSPSRLVSILVRQQQRSSSSLKYSTWESQLVLTIGWLFQSRGQQLRQIQSQCSLRCSQRGSESLSRQEGKSMRLRILGLRQRELRKREMNSDCTSTRLLSFFLYQYSVMSFVRDIRGKMLQNSSSLQNTRPSASICSSVSHLTYETCLGGGGPPTRGGVASNSMTQNDAALSALKCRFSHPSTRMRRGRLNCGSRLVQLRLRSAREARVVRMLIISSRLASFLLVSWRSLLTVTKTSSAVAASKKERWMQRVRPKRKRRLTKEWPLGARSTWEYLSREILRQLLVFLQATMAMSDRMYSVQALSMQAASYSFTKYRASASMMPPKRESSTISIWSFSLFSRERLFCWLTLWQHSMASCSGWQSGCPFSIFPAQSRRIRWYFSGRWKGLLNRSSKVMMRFSVERRFSISLAPPFSDRICFSRRCVSLKFLKQSEYTRRNLEKRIMVCAIMVFRRSQASNLALSSSRSCTERPIMDSTLGNMRATSFSLMHCDSQRGCCMRSLMLMRSFRQSSSVVTSSRSRQQRSLERMASFFHLTVAPPASTMQRSFTLASCDDYISNQTIIYPKAPQPYRTSSGMQIRHMTRYQIQDHSLVLAEELGHVLDEVLVEAQVDDLVLEVSQFVVGFHEFSESAFEVAVAGGDAAQVCILLGELFPQAVVVVLAAEQLVLVVVLQRYFVLPHYDLHLAFFVLDRG